MSPLPVHKVNVEVPMMLEREKFSVRAERCVMSASDAVANNVQAWLRAIAETLGRVSLKETFNHLSKQTGLTLGQVKRLWYGEWNVIPAYVFLAVANAYKSAISRAVAYADHQRAVYAALSKEWDDTWGDTFSSCAPTGSENGQSLPSTEQSD